MNNLLERLHASFFFFILTTPDRFMKIGSYLPSVILISVAMMFRGLRCWVDAGWKHDHPSKNNDSPSPNVITWSKRTRPVLHVLATMLATHLLGIALFFTARSSWFLGDQKVDSWQSGSAILLKIYLVTRAHCHICPLSTSLRIIEDPLRAKTRCCSFLAYLEGIEPLLHVNCDLHHHITEFLFGCFASRHARTSAFPCPSR